MLKRYTHSIAAAILCVAATGQLSQANSYNVPDAVLQLSVAEYSELGILQRRDMMQRLVEAEHIEYFDLNACLTEQGFRSDAHQIRMDAALFACVRYARDRVSTAG
jgi:hypothetical protein